MRTDETTTLRPAPYVADGDHASSTLPERHDVYDLGYWRKYQSYHDTPLGVALDRYRAGLLGRHAGPGCRVLDHGIGSGSFLEEAECRGFRPSGFDVNPYAEWWLRYRGWWLNPYGPGGLSGVSALACWDSLEHLKDPGRLLGLVPAGAAVLVSMPVYRGAWEDLPSWKHYRPAEHYHYWRGDGFPVWMGRRGFELVEQGDGETRLGRVDVMSYVFRSTGKAVARGERTGGPDEAGP